MFGQSYKQPTILWAFKMENLSSTWQFSHGKEYIQKENMWDWKTNGKIIKLPKMKNVKGRTCIDSLSYRTALINLQWG